MKVLLKNGRFVKGMKKGNRVDLLSSGETVKLRGGSGEGTIFLQQKSTKNNKRNQKGEWACDNRQTSKSKSQDQNLWNLFEGKL